MDNKGFKDFVVEKLFAITDGITLLLENEGITTDNELDCIPKSFGKGYFNIFERKHFIFTNTEFQVYKAIQSHINPNQFTVFPKVRLNYLFAPKKNTEKSKLKLKHRHLFRTMDFVIASAETAKPIGFVIIDYSLINVIDTQTKQQARWRENNNKVIESLFESNSEKLITITDVDINLKEAQLTEAGINKINIVTVKT